MKPVTNAAQVRETMRRKIMGLPPGKAREVLESFYAESKRKDWEISKQKCREFSNGFWSQSLDFHMRICLGRRMKKDEGGRF